MCHHNPTGGVSNETLSCNLNLFCNAHACSNLGLGRTLSQAGAPLAVQVGWDVALNGVLYVRYDNNHNGRVDFHTLRIVEKSFYSREKVPVLGEYFPGKLIFFVDCGSENYFYVTRG